MFRSKLIEDQTYYRLRRKQLILNFVAIIPMSLIWGLYNWQFWILLVGLALYVGAILLMRRNQQVMELFAGNKFLELDEEALRVVSKNRKIIETINLESTSSIILKKEYDLYQHSIKDVFSEVVAVEKGNSVILDVEGEKRVFLFEIDSHYKLKQLSKIIDCWLQKHYNIERV